METEMTEESSPIERQLAVISDPGSALDTFRNEHPLWRPGPRGIFGGIAIAQSLRSAQLTVHDDFDAHSMHCSFVHAGTAEEAIFYQVERVRDGKNFCTRSVRATQGKRPIFLAMISFARHKKAEEAPALEHAIRIPKNIPVTEEKFNSDLDRGLPPQTPFLNKSVGILKCPSSLAEDQRFHQWIRARGKISARENQSMHLGALAFMSDSYFLAAVPHSHGVWDFIHAPVTEFYQSPADLFGSSETHKPIKRPHFGYSDRKAGIHAATVLMMVSLDHTIYFHSPRQLRADEWLFSEVNTSWARDGRGLIHQKIWMQNGTLVATCIQEVR